MQNVLGWLRGYSSYVPKILAPNIPQFAMHNLDCCWSFNAIFAIANLDYKNLDSHFCTSLVISLCHPTSWGCKRVCLLFDSSEEDNHHFIVPHHVVVCLNCSEELRVLVIPFVGCQESIINKNYLDTRVVRSLVSKFLSVFSSGTSLSFRCPRLQSYLSIKFKATIRT